MTLITLFIACISLAAFIYIVTVFVTRVIESVINKRNTTFGFETVLMIISAVSFFITCVILYYGK
jgi:large-conductance mechanosensitive channel